MKKKVLAVVTSAVLALGCFASVSAYDLEVIDSGNTHTVTKKAATASEKEAYGEKGTINTALDWAEIYTGVNNGSITINGKKANAAQKKAVKAVRDAKIFSLGNMSLDYSLTTDDYQIAGIAWTDAEKITYLTHLYAQAGTEKVVRVFQITADDADASNPVKVSVVDSDVKASKKYALRHFKDGVWDNTSGKVTSVVNGVVTAEITKASPFALVELTGSAAPAADNKDAAAKNATGTKTAPKTGEV